MMNYIWIALIIIAVVYAGYRDISGDPPKTDPPDETIAEYEEGNYQTLGYDFEEGKQTAELSVEMDLERETGDISSIQLFYRGETGENILVGRFTDADGETFLAPFTTVIREERDWQRGEFLVSDMIPTTDNPLADVDQPLQFDSLILTASDRAENQQGEFIFNEVRAAFPETYLTDSEDVQSERWMGVITKSTARWAEISIGLAINLIGIMMLWLGLMRIAEEAGLVRVIARALKPIMVRLFPELPPEGDAMGAIIMNMAANMLGLGNAATPLGLKAMEELQEVNENKEYASNAMCMLLSLNTSSVTLIPPTIIGYRVAAGSEDIMIFWPLMIGTTVTSTIFAITACKILEKLPMFRIPENAGKEVKKS